VVTGEDRTHKANVCSLSAGPFAGSAEPYVRQPDRVTVRVAALVIQHGRVLVVYQNKDGRMCWMLPGGTADFAETFADALRREMAEELDLDLMVERPLAIVESISPDLEAYPVHMLHVVMLCTARRPVDLEALMVSDENTRDVRLVEPSQLNGLDLRPGIAAFIAQCVERVPDGVSYLGVRW
jgi:ADP-ribose pyrophosphatase YjhB (NUDIX family)